MPLTADPELFASAAALGEELIWLHTFAQRMIGPGRLKGELPHGRARLARAITGSPREFAYHPEAQTLAIGAGAVAPVGPEAWGWSISGFPVVQSWLRYRMHEGSGRARSFASPLDRIRPAEWSARYTAELLELLWVIEASVARSAEHASMLDAICDGPLIPPADLGAVG